MNLSRAFLPLVLVAAASAATAADRTVEVANKPGDPWKPQLTRTLDDLPTAARAQMDGKLSQFGGLAERRLKATGFFYATNLNQRWWLVDPEGCLFLSKGVSSVSQLRTPGAEVALRERFGSEAQWAAGTLALLRTNGFNSLGAWSDTASLTAAQPRLPYTRIWNFMSSYGKKRGGTFQQPGHTGYPGDCIFVFDPEFPAFCDEYARQLEAGRDDPWLLGHFSDNEMPLKREALKNYLTLPEKDPGRMAAEAWLCGRHGEKATAANITPQDEQDFLAVVVDRYYRTVGQAIKRHDPHHLFLGSRFHGADLRYPEIFRAAGPHVDIVAVNYYRAWTPDPERIAMWAQEAGKPIIITEWYAKGADAGLANTGGAGWLVKTQRDRALFYENFTLGLLASPACVGWHWFKYADNDPEDKKVDPSNRDSNKGMVSNRYTPYAPLLDSMKRINERAYSLADWFAKQPAPPAPPAK